MLGDTEGDQKLFFEQGDRLKLTTNESHIATEKNMTIAVRNCSKFNENQVGPNIFFDMGSISALVKSVTDEVIEVELQNEGWIYAG